jgi:hypothetical protein
LATPRKANPKTPSESARSGIAVVIARKGSETAARLATEPLITRCAHCRRAWRADGIEHGADWALAQVREHDCEASFRAKLKAVKPTPIVGLPERRTADFRVSPRVERASVVA